MAASTSNTKEVPKFDPCWKIIKTLGRAEIGGKSYGILLPHQMVKQSVLANWDAELVKRINAGEKYEVNVRDINTCTDHKLIFVKERGSYYLKGDNWRTEFVDGKKLKEDYVIGLFWNSIHSCFVFSVLKKGHYLEYDKEKAQPPPPPPPPPRRDGPINTDLKLSMGEI